jgi:tetratricopeptide (TPR) repeat protein
VGKSTESDEEQSHQSPNGALDDFPVELRDQAAAALEAETSSLERAIDAWKRLVSSAPTAWAPRRELARVYKQAERWKACVETLKEGVEKAVFPSQAEKIPVLFEMVEVYRDRLKLDVMVVNAFNQILTIQPDNLQAVDALARQYESMGRWPELIAILRKKAAVVTDLEDKVTLYLRVANLYLEKFSNQAEAIKAFEAALELDPGNERAVTYLKQMYEKRRDWEKLVMLARSEVTRVSDNEERRRRRIEVARLASEKLKKPAVSIELWREVLSEKDDDEEPLLELEKLYEREKDWGELCAILERQTQVAPPARRGQSLLKLALLYTEKLLDNDRAVTAWKALLDAEPENRRAQDALRKLYLQQKDWDALEGFYAAQGKWDEFVRVLERQTDVEDDRAKVGLLGKIGELYRDRLNKADRAQRAFERALQLDPAYLAGAEALIPFYERNKDPARLAAVLTVRLAHTTDPGARQELMNRLNELYETGVGDKTAALVMALQAFSEDPRASWSRERAERLAAATSSWADLVTAYEQALAQAQGAEEALPLLATLAQAYEKELANPELAIERNRTILSFDPRNSEAILALERLYVTTGRHAELLAIYDKKLELASDERERRHVQLQLASLYEDEIRDTEKAIGLYRDILQASPRDPSALKALDRLYRGNGQWKELIEIVDRELEIAPDDATRAELMFRKGEVAEKELGQKKQAVEAYRDALGLDAGQMGARAALETYLGEKRYQMIAVSALEPIYEKSEDLQRLIGVLRIRLAHAKDAPERVALELRIGALESALGHGEESFTAYAQAFREDPTSEPARTALEDLADSFGDLGRWNTLVALYGEALGSGRLEADLERELLFRVAVAYDEKLGESQKAVEYFQRAQEIQPEDPAALDALERLYTRTERWPDLVDTLRKKTELLAAPEERERIHVQIATLWEEAIGNPEEATGAWKDVLGDNPRSLLALRALERLFQQRGLDLELADNLQRQLELSEDPDVVVLLLGRLGRLRQDRLSDLTGAVETYRRVLELAPVHLETIEALERLLPYPDQEIEVAAMLEPVYRARNDFPNLIRVLEIEARHTQEGGRRIALLHEIASAWEDGCDDPAQAYDAYTRALAENPVDQDTQHRIERLARVLGRHDDLLARYETIAGSVADEDVRRALYHKIAALAEAGPGGDERAAAAYIKALELGGGDLDAANALERIYVRSSNHARLVDLYERKMGMVDSVEEKKELGLKAAKVHEETLDSPEKAILVYRQILAIDESDQLALENLERLYIRLERWQELKDIYARKADLASEPHDKRQMLFVLGQVYDRELRAPEKAIETYNAILDLDANDYEALQSLDRLYAQTERWLDLLSVLERETELSQAPAEVLSLRFRVGELWREKLQDAERAAEAYRVVLTMDPTHEPTLRALERMMDGEDALLAAQVLEPVYETAGEWDRVAVVYEVMARHSDDPIRRIALYCMIAAIHERRRVDLEGAFEAYTRAFRLDPTNPEVIAHLDRLALATVRWADLAAVYEAELPNIHQSQLQVETLLRVARIQEEELRESDKAIAVYRRVIDIEPDRREALTALDRLYTGGKIWRELSEVLRSEIRLAQTEEESTVLQYRLAQVLEVELGDLPRAVETYQEILAFDPAHPGTRAALERLLTSGSLQHEVAQVLEPLYRAGEEWEKLQELYRLEFARLTDPSERQSLLRRLADIAENQLFDQVQALDWWSRAVAEDPRSEEALDELLRLARDTHQWEGYVGTMLEVAPSGADPSVRRDVLMRLATVFESDLGELGRAEEVLNQVLGDHPGDVAALAFLDRIYDRQGTFDQLAEVLRRRLVVTVDSRELVSLHLRLGRILADVLADPVGAMASFEAVLEQDTRNAEALEALERLYLRGERWKDLYGIYEAMLDIAPGPAAQADCYARMARLSSEAFDDRGRAIALWRKVLDLRGADPTGLAALADLYEQAGEWRELTEVIDNQIRATEEPQERIPLHKRLGRIWGDKLQRERNALESWQQVLEIDPGDVEALRAIAENYRIAGAWEELSDTLQRLIDLGAAALGDDELKELYAQLGELEGATLMRTDRAILAWRRVLELDAGDFRALAALETLYTQEGRWEECVEVLERRATALASPEDQVDVLMQVANIWVDKIGDGGAAAEVYERILALDPGNMVASTELEQLYRQRKSWMKLVELLLSRTEFLSEHRERITLLRQIAEIYEQELGDRDSAFVTLQAAFREDYSNDHVAGELERLATAAGRWNELLSDYTQVVQTIPDARQAADLWVKIARWYDSAVNRTDYAIASANQALQLDPAHVEALQALEDFYRKQAQWRELVQVLARHAQVESQGVRRVELLIALAEVHESQLGDAAQAMLAYQQALDNDDRCIEAINALERLYRRTQAWDRLVDVLNRKAVTVDDVEVAVKLRLQVGEIWEERLGDDEQAVEAFKEVLSVDPQNMEALKALERLYEKTGKMEAYLDVLEHQLEGTSSEEERVSLYARMAEVWEQQFDKSDRAIDCLQKVLLVDARNQSAYRDLERLYRAERRWDALADIYRNHILISEDSDERIQLYLQMGQVYEEELRDPERAIEAYVDVLAAEPAHADALRGAARLYEQTEQWERAEDAMRRLIPLSADKEKVDLNFRLGRIFDEQLRTPEIAEERFIEALSLDPTHLASMLALLNLYRLRGDMQKAAQLMVRAEQHTINLLEKTRLLSEAGRIYQRDLGDEDKAAELFGRTLMLDPEHVEAAEPLSEIYFRRQAWSNLLPVLEMLVRKTERRPKAELALLHYRVAKTADQLGDSDKALRHYKQAYDFDSTHFPTLLDRASLLYRREQWDEAFKLYQTILVHHREAQKDSDIVEIFHRIGQIKLKTGERAKAINMFEKALEIQPGHRPTLEALIEIYTAANDWEAVIRQRRALLAHSDDVTRKLEIQQQIIDIYRTKLQNPQKAIAAYLEALEFKPADHKLLHDVLDLFTETKQWKKGVEILLKLAGLETGKLRAKYLEAAGNITNYELHAADDAIELYNQALDEDPDNLKTFERIDKILTSKKDWKSQERAYRRMIKRMGQDVGTERRQTQVALWHALGEIYRSRLKDFRAAAQAFEVAVELEPGALARRQILAELYQLLGPESYERAIAEYRAIVRRTDDLNVMGTHLKTLRRLYADLGQYDRAWCVASVLAFLRKADPEEQRFFEQYRPKNFARAKARLTEELWQRNIYHPEEDRLISHVLAAVSFPVMAIRAREHKDWGLKRKDRRDPSTDQLLFSKVFNYVAQVLAVAPPELYLRPESPGELDMANAREKSQLVPSFVVGSGLLQGRPEKDLAYVIGKRLTLMRPEHLVRWPHVVPTVAELRVVFLAALKLVQPQVPIKPELQQAVGQYLALLRKTVPPQLMEQLASVVQRFIETKAEADLHVWSNAVDYTATRAGYLMCGDLDVAARLVQTEPVAVGSVEPKEKIRDLIQWTVSEEYFALREHLGLTIG